MQVTAIMKEYLGPFGYSSNLRRLATTKSNYLFLFSKSIPLLKAQNSIPVRVMNSINCVPNIS